MSLSETSQATQEIITHPCTQGKKCESTEGRTFIQKEYKAQCKHSELLYSPGKNSCIKEQNNDVDLQGGFI